MMLLIGITVPEGTTKSIADTIGCMVARRR
jgi:hypothetical protein